MDTIKSIYNGIACTITLCGHTTTIVALECLALFFWPFSENFYYSYLSHIMRQWAHNLFQVMDRFNPGDLIITFDRSFTEDQPVDISTEEEDPLEHYLTRNNKGQVIGISFPERLITIANHQIYADWIYIWFLAYLGKAHGSLKIMLKHSLSYVPIYGLLEQDRDNIINNLSAAKKAKRPLWLVLFPEGTVISDDTRLKSKNYAQKLNREDFKYTLLPRTTGLLLAKEALGDSVEWIYDITIAYPGIEQGMNPEDVMTMKYMFCDGKGPKKIHMFIERFKLSTLPSDTEEFSQWLLNRWSLKDERLVYFNEHGRLPEEIDIGSDEDERIYNDRTVRIPIKPQHPFRECYTYMLYLIFYIPVIYLSLIVIHYLISLFTI